MNKLSYLETDCLHPHHNLALEEYLLQSVEDDEVILYLWQNEHTVVIGRNQHSRAECRVERLAQDGGHLARRLSGGGAVFHDLGNLNFTFLAKERAYHLDRQMEVILCAVRSLGIRAERSGRNDITLDGRKFSGNAFYRSGGRCYHHGTLLLHADLGRLLHYLTVSKEKLQSHGVRSVRSRVMNLCEVRPQLGVLEMKTALKAAATAVYGLPLQDLPQSRIAPATLQILAEKNASSDWLFGRERDAAYEFTRRFTWGEVRLRLSLEAGMVSHVALYTDALDADLPQRVETLLVGQVCSAPQLAAKLREAAKSAPDSAAALEDLALLVLQGMA